MARPRKQPLPKRPPSLMEIPITPLLVSEARQMASHGLTVEQIAYNLGMGKSTIYEKFRKHPDLLDAINKGKAEGVKKIANKLFDEAEKGETKCMMFYLKCRGGWREVQQIETIDRTGDVDSFDGKDPIEASKKYQELMG